jgi:hypothetical protein
MRAGALFLFLFLFHTSEVRAQSLTAGTVTGTVQDENGTPLHEAGVTLVDRATGVSRSLVTPRGGQFVFSLLPAGRYELFVEQLAYRPRRVIGVTVPPGGTVHVPVALTRVRPPVDRVDTTLHHATVVAETGRSSGHAGFRLAELAGEKRALSSLGALATTTSEQLEIEGLPGRFSGLAVDGIVHAFARHPRVGESSLDALSLPLGAFELAGLTTSGADVEWRGLPGGFFSGYSRRGTDRTDGGSLLEWAGGGYRASAVVGGPVLPDTAHFALGFDARRDQTVFPAPWSRSSADTAFADIARDSAGVFLGPYFDDVTVRTDLLSGFGRFDWVVTPSHLLAARASVANAKIQNAAPDGAVGIGSTLEATDVTASAALTSRLSSGLSQELRFGVGYSARDYRAGPLVGTLIADVGRGVGASSSLPGRFGRTTIQAGQTMHISAGVHRFKLGLQLAFSFHDHTYADDRGGTFVFAGEDEFSTFSGLFSQTVGSLPVAVFSTSSVGLYAQDLWRPAPGLELLLGVRYDVERLPTDEVRRNQEWLTRTGLDNTGIGGSRRKLSPRFGFRWSSGEGERWVLSGAAGVYHGEIDPADLAEVITYDDGTTRSRRAVGPLGPWPRVPDSTTAPVLGPRLALLNSELDAPRTGRVSLEISRAFGSRAVVRLSGVYRHTDFLPRRRDLNLVGAAGGTDQYGRPLYGTLVVAGATASGDTLGYGSLLAAAPRSNRRFTDFDVVSAIDPDGYSDYWGVTISLERVTAGRASFVASYTFSRAEDNWTGARDGTPEALLPPFQDTVRGEDWTVGRSDFDVPHRVLVGLDVAVSRRLGARVAALYRFRSGYPFTPGLRAGVDANGDGSGRNDPAFVTDTVAGFDAVLSQWDCLRTQIGRFAERNACRAEPSHSLDARLALRVATLRGSPLELAVDALNLIQSDRGEVDNALYLVDRARPVVRDPQTGVVNVPLVVNPDFGSVLTSRIPKRLFRVGVRLNY